MSDATYEAWEIRPISANHDEYSPFILENLLLKTIPKPLPGPRQTLVRVRAAALNFRDLLVISGSPKYPVHASEGLSPCSDGAGTIEAVGPDSEWKIGDDVMLRPNQSWVDGGVENFDKSLVLGAGDVDGTLTQYRIVDDQWLNKKPQNLTFEEAAALPTAGGTAANALFQDGILSRFALRGKTILTQGTGGVSLFAVQLAAAAGANVIATSTSKSKMDIIKAAGAHHTINYKDSPDWAEEVLEITNGEGVDLIVEVGGAGTIQQSLKASRIGGRIVVIGILTASQEADLIPAILFGAKTVQGILGSSKVMGDKLVDFVSTHGIRPVIGKTFDWKEAPEAFRLMMEQGTIGKIVVKI